MMLVRLRNSLKSDWRTQAMSPLFKTSRANRRLILFRVRGAQKSLFRSKVTFPPKSDFWAPKSKKCESEFWTQKSHFSSPGPQKTSGNHCLQAHRRAWARQVAFGTWTSKKATFGYKSNSLAQSEFWAKKWVSSSPDSKKDKIPIGF